MTRAKPTLLMVEDHELLRSTLTHHFDADFEVIAVGSGEEAIQAIGNLPTINLLLTDFDLRGPLDGLDVARAMKVKDSQAPILLVTGSGETLPRVKEILSLPGTALLGKPFHLEAIEHAVGTLLILGRVS